MLPFRSPRRGDGCRRSLRLVDDMLREAQELDTSPARWRCIPKVLPVLSVPGFACVIICSFFYNPCIMRFLASCAY
jgi:hypothetical protein